MKAVRRKSRWSFYWGLLPVVSVFFAWQGWVWWSWVSAPAIDPKTIESEAESPPAKVIEVKTGSTGQEIGATLEAEGLIRSTQAWNVWARWLSLTKRGGGFQVGSYEINPTEPMTEIAAKIWSGDVLKLSYTIPEGWTIEDMAEYFEDQGFFKAETFVEATKNVPYDLFPWLPKDLPHVEGFLYPDTYLLRSDRLDAESVVSQMIGQFEVVALPVYEQSAGEKDLSLLDWVTLASIVEREAVISEERRLISGVFHNRLTEGIPLGADPTVEYGLGLTQTADRPLTYEEVATPSPYNTYINAGLPPTPIGSPGLPSLEATLSPEATDYLYFVARYDGTHVFSRTLAEHEAAQAEIWNERDSQ